MDREYTYLLHLMGAFLREEVPQRMDGIDWPRLVEFSQIHCVTGILGYMVYTHKLCSDPQITKELRQTCISTMMLFNQRAALFDEFSDFLAHNNIDHICMKGQVLRNYYPIPELRTFSDIDLVIRASDRKACHKLMLSHDFQVKNDWEPVYSYLRDQEYYEIHTEIMEVDVSDKADYKGYFQQAWQHTFPAGNHRYELKHEFHFLYILTHIAKHIRGSGAGIRMYIDIAAFMLHFGDSLDWSWIAEELNKLKLQQFAATVISGVCKWFGISSPAPVVSVPDYILDEFLVFTLEAGIFGHHSRENGIAALKNAAQLNQSARIKLLINRAFPSAKTIQRRYTYLQKYPALLPVAWIHRFLKTRDSFHSHAAEAEVILSAESKEISRLKKISEMIGLR